jgi:hypothetical protein
MGKAVSSGSTFLFSAIEMSKCRTCPEEFPGKSIRACRGIWPLLVVEESYNLIRVPPTYAISFPYTR